MNIRPLSSALALKAETELNEDPKKPYKNLGSLDLWFTDNPEIRVRRNNQFRLSFLRNSAHCVERTAYVLQRYYHLRTAIPELATNSDPMQQKNFDLNRMGVMLPLPETLTPDGPRIIILRITPSMDPSKYTMEDLLCATRFIRDILTLEDDNSVIAGQIAIVDLAGASEDHLNQVTPDVLHKVYLFIQDGAPVRMKGFHFINQPTGFETVLNIIKRFNWREKTASKVRLLALCNSR